MIYDNLLLEADSEKLIVREKNIPGYNGRIYKNRIAINKDIPTNTEKACILAEELGHYHTTVGNILDQSKVENRKQELQARAWAYNKMIGLLGIVKAFEHGCTTLYDTAEYLEVTEEFLQDALDYYHRKYGMYTSIDNYVIYFEPTIGIFKKVRDVL